MFQCLRHPGSQGPPDEVGSPVHRLIRGVEVEGRGFPAAVWVRGGHDSKGNVLGMCGKCA